MSAKKSVLIIIVNCLIFIGLCFCLEKEVKNNPDFVSKFDILLRGKSQINERQVKVDKYYIDDIPDGFVRLDYTKENYEKFCGEKRVGYGEKYKGNPIIVMGCSYAYGQGMKKEKTFPFFLSEITKKPVNSYAVCGGNAVASIKLIQENPDILSDADYIIYVYMWDHINRHISMPQFMQVYNELYKPSKIVKILNNSYLFKYMNVALNRFKIIREYPNSEQSILYQEKLFLYWYKIIKKYAPNAKVIIIVYDEKIPFKVEKSRIKYVIDVMNSGIWKNLEEKTQGGIQVVHTKDVTGFVFDKNWKLKADIAAWHPNDKVWEYFTPLFAEKYIK